MRKIRFDGIVVAAVFSAAFAILGITQSGGEDGFLINFLVGLIVFAMVFFPLAAVVLIRRIVRKIRSSKRPVTRVSSSPRGAAPTPAKKAVSVTLRQMDLHRIADIKALKDFVVFDTETTGLSAHHDSLIELGAVEYVACEEVARYGTLINPQKPIPASASGVNGIFDADVADAPTEAEAIPEFIAFIGGKTVCGYNVSFDLGFLRTAIERSGQDVTITYFDVLSLARRAWPMLPNHKLQTVAQHLGLLQEEQSHRAVDDAALTAKVLIKAIEQLIGNHEQELAEKRAAKHAAEDARRKKYAASPLLDKTFAFTGDFDTDREELEKMLDRVGALLRQSVTKKLNYLVVGDIDNLPDWAVERKQGKADELIGEGAEIEVINEEEYLELIENAWIAIKNDQ